MFFFYRFNSLKLPDDRIQTYSTNIDRAMSMDPQMLVIVVPNQNVDKYELYE